MLVRVLVALTLAVMATAVGIVWRGETPKAPLLVATAKLPAPAPDPPPDQWVVRVDGWSVSFAEVEAGTAGEEHVVARSAGLRATSSFSSAFDPLIVHHAANQGLDWRLVSALIYEESRFEPDSLSDKGAYGLMQVTEIAARDVDEERFYTPDENVRTGTRYLKRLGQMFATAHGWDRLALTLAAYHMGPAHVFDAQSLARRAGYDPLRWSGSMERVLPLLEESTVYRSLPNGYAQGELTVRYVERVLDRFLRHRASEEGVVALMD